MNSESGNNSSEDPLVTAENSSKAKDQKSSSWLRRSFNPFRIATLRGLAVVLPPLLTIMLFVWAWNTIDRAIIGPVESITRYCVAWAVEDIRTDETIVAELESAANLDNRMRMVDDEQVFTANDGTELTKVADEWLPYEVFDRVKDSPGDASLNSAHDYYSRYVQIRYLTVSYTHLTLPTNREV